jgi:hypothetical protein
LTILIPHEFSVDTSQTGANKKVRPGRDLKEEEFGTAGIYLPKTNGERKERDSQFISLPVDCLIWTLAIGELKKISKTDGVC